MTNKYDDEYTQNLIDIINACKKEYITCSEKLKEINESIKELEDTETLDHLTIRQIKVKQKQDEQKRSLFFADLAKLTILLSLDKKKYKFTSYRQDNKRHYFIDDIELNSNAFNKQYFQKYSHNKPLREKKDITKKQIIAKILELIALVLTFIALINTAFAVPLFAGLVAVLIQTVSFFKSNSETITQDDLILYNKSLLNETQKYNQEINKIENSIPFNYALLLNKKEKLKEELEDKANLLNYYDIRLNEIMNPSIALEEPKLSQPKVLVKKTK
jgi:hypothetical protein